MPSHMMLPFLALSAVLAILALGFVGYARIIRRRAAAARLQGRPRTPAPWRAGRAPTFK